MRRYRLAILITLLAGVMVASGRVWWISRRPIHLTLTAGQPGGTYLPIAQEIARIVSTQHPQLRINVVPSSGGNENLQRLQTGQADLAITQNDADGGADTRTLIPLYLEVFHFLTCRDLPIRSVNDLKGHAVAVGSRGSGTETVFHQVLAHYGLTYKDIQPRFIGPTEAVDQLIAGKIHAMVFMAGLKSPACERAIQSNQVRFVSIGSTIETGSEVQGIRIEYPFITQATIPVLTYASPGIDGGGEPQQPIATLGVQSILACRENLPNWIAYAITRSIFQHRARLIRKLPVAVQINEQFNRSSVQFAVHPGATQFYRRREPGFLVTYAEPMAFGLSGLIATIALGSGIREWVRRRKKNRIDTYYLSLLKILDQLRHADLPASQLNKLRKQLTHMHHQAFQQLVNEELLADESFRIFQTMIIDCQCQVDRQLDTPSD